MSRNAVAIVHAEEFINYDFGPNHPLRPERIPLGLDLLRELELWHPEAETLLPQLATVEEIESVHSPEYVSAVQEASVGGFPSHKLARFGLTSPDNPAFPGMHESAALVTGGTIQAARAIAGGSLLHAFNPAGGWHHAGRDRASGFCIYNDAAAAASLLSREYGTRTLYVDFDCHHGDGVQWIFYGDRNVMTISFHESGRYLFPGTGFANEMGEGEGTGFCVNLPMLPFTQDASWLEAVEAILPDCAYRFKPDIIISNHGADTHIWDPLTHLALTTETFVRQAATVHALAHELTAGRWLAVGSGGYAWRTVVPRSWAIVWAEMSGRHLPDTLPLAWRSRWRSADESLPERLLDSPDISPPIPESKAIVEENRRTVQTVRTQLGLARAWSVPAQR